MRVKLSIIIPCFNEKATVEAVVAAVRAAPPADKEIILVDDGSTDGTRELVLERLAPRVDRVVLRARNRGKGAAVRDGLAVAAGNIIIIQDADLEYDPGDYRRLVAPIERGEADVVYGSRFSGAARRPVSSLPHRAVNRFLTLLSNALTGLDLSDMETCYKAFRAGLISPGELREERFGFEPEFTARIARRRCRVREVPVSYRGRGRRDGKKIGWRDGVRAVYCIFRYNLFPG